MTLLSMSRLHGLRKPVALLASLLPVAAHPASVVSGHVLALNGRALSQAMVTLTKQAGQPGPTAVTVFTDEAGRFEFPDGLNSAAPTARALGYRQVDAVSKSTADGIEATLIMRPEANQAGVAPASAWLAHIASPDDRSVLVMTCVACHQLPAPEVRAYAKLIYDIPNVEAAAAREQSWHAILRYMNNLTALPGRSPGQSTESNGVYTVGKGDATVQLLARSLIGPLQNIEGYQYGAPILAGAHTVIREYEVPRPNAIREAITLDDPNTLWVADQAANRLIRIDATTGGQRNVDLHTETLTGLHTLVRGKDGSLWIALIHNNVIGRFEPKSERWQAWTPQTGHGEMADVHDVTFNSERELTADRRGRVWFTGIENNTIGWLDPKTGKSGVYAVPPVAGRIGIELPYGIAMASDRIHVWYTQLGIGCFGSFNTQTLQFETFVQLPDPNAGPRRVALSDQDILYIALFGAGQLAEYDTRRRRMIGVYDLPDRASAPYGVTWDPKRKVVWVPTSNANLIYRFDPRDKSFAVLPLPREGSYLRMLSLDKTTGALVTSSANIGDNALGPRMAIKIDLGDGNGGAVGSAIRTAAGRKGRSE